MSQFWMGFVIGLNGTFGLLSIAHKMRSGVMKELLHEIQDLMSDIKELESECDELERARDILNEGPTVIKSHGVNLC